MPAENYDPEQVVAWAHSAIPARNVSFDDAGNCLVVGRYRFALSDTVIVLTGEQLAQACGAFMLKIIAPGLAAAALAEGTLPDPAHRCAVCGRNWVDSDAGQDTCEDCKRRI